MPVAPDDIDNVRRFNRFYTRLVGALDEGHLSSEYSLAEVRVMYELAHHDAVTARHLTDLLDLDPGYLSRLLAKLTARKLVKRTRADDDAREQNLALTRAGHTTFNRLDAKARDVVRELLAPLSDDNRALLSHQMLDIRTLLGDNPPEERTAVVLREHRPGDMGWVVERHGTLYWREFHWDERFEGLVARICADFIAHFDASCERCWIAEIDGVRVGSVFVVKHPERAGAAKLRLLLVDPSARGAGVGRALVRECTRFAREAGYNALTLWTNNVLVSARRIYEAEGYVLVKEEEHRSFGHVLTGQNWELSL